ncbi:hypothetical protein PM082_009171 [Marasmius tenuissimus]|nr:hypothetical protein PM082_009171 [Marasmius tenuissimus]
MQEACCTAYTGFQIDETHEGGTLGKASTDDQIPYQPYAALRQRFWYQYLKQYDTDDTLTVSHLELTSMLDSLGSTLTDSTINSFFTRFNKQPHQDDLTILETIQCLETELGRPDAEKNRVEEGDTGSRYSLDPDENQSVEVE